MLDQLLRLLLREPLVAVFVIGLLINVIGSVFKAAGKAGQRGSSRPGTGPQSRAPTAPAPARRSAPTPSQSPRQASAEDIAAEMRRILGMESPPKPAPARPQPPPVPAERPRPARSEATAGDRAPEPLRTPSLGSIAIHVDPKVGTNIAQRRAPATGAVGAHQLGDLGGRSGGTGRRRRDGRHLVDLSNLSRAIVLREILDPPLGLRDQRGPF